MRLPDQARQADRAAINQGHTEAAAEDAEARGVRYDAQVAPEGEFHAARHGKALNGGDHRL